MYGQQAPVQFVNAIKVVTPVFVLQPTPEAMIVVQQGFMCQDVFMGMEMVQETTQEVATQSYEVDGTTYYKTSDCQEAMSSGCSSDGSITPPMMVDVGFPYVEEVSPILELLRSWCLTHHERYIAGYPIVDHMNCLRIRKTYWDESFKMWIDENETTRKCARCFETYEVSADGQQFPVGKDICHYKFRGELKTADSHLSSQRFASELGKFVVTPAPFGTNDQRSNEVYALDAEMVLTTAGPALARLSVVSFEGQLVLDIVVRPEAPVIDCLTEFSGITMETLDSATASLESAQNCLFQLINSETILVGHGLESDLKALRLVHGNVIDTSIMFQDEGRNKVALRVLAKELLDRTIQADNASTFGHCSEEDALASLDLVKFQLGLMLG